MPYGRYGSMGMGMYGGGNQGFLGGLGSGLSEGLRAAMQYKLDRAEAERMAQQVAWAQNPSNPENQLRFQEARALGNTKNSTIDAGTLFGPQFRGRQIPVDQALPYLFAKFGLMKSGPIASGAKAGAGGSGMVPLDPEDQKTIQDLTTELSTLKGAYETANKSNLFKKGVGNDVAQGLLKMNLEGAPFIGNMVSNNLPAGAMDYNTRMKDAMYRVSKILSGGRPNQQMQEDLQRQIPQIGLDPQLAQQQFNALLGSAEARAQGLVNKKRALGLEDQAQALSDQLNGLFGQYRIGEEGGSSTSNLPGSGIQPQAQGTGTIPAVPDTGSTQQPPSTPAAPATPDIDALLAAYRAQKVAQQAAPGGASAAQP